MALQDRAGIAKWVNIVGVGLLLIGLGVAISRNIQEDETGMTREQLAWELIGSGALILDVRTREEFDAGHLPGAILIPHTEIGERMGELGADKDRPVVIYCKAGGRAGTAEKVLEAHGWTHLHNGGGYDAIMAAKGD